MNEAMPPGEDLPEAKVQTRRRPFQIVWLVPLVAAIVAGFLAWHAWSQQGPVITITWKTGDGLQAGQTKVRHKAVELGTVRSVELSPDMSHVIARVEMQRQAARYLTRDARFWVVRPRFNAGNISGFETLVSGSYIELDPGSPNLPPQRHFVGLEEPPAVRSDEPGRTFLLTTDRIGSLGSGAPVFYRDIAAGEVLGFDLGPDGRRVTLQVFVRAPYDKFVREGSHFWNASGVSFDLGANGAHLRLESLRAALTGGVAFDTDEQAMSTPVSAPGSTFTLYHDEATARSAGYKETIKVVSYVQGSVRGLAKGAPVEFYGIQIGTVTDVRLLFDPASANARVAVHMDIQPGRFMHDGEKQDPLVLSRTLVQRGLRVQLRTASYLTGQLLVAMDFFPQAAPAEVKEEDGEIILPSAPGGLDSITASLGDLMAKLNALPLQQIATNLNQTLAGANALANGGELRDSLKALSTTLASTQDLVTRLDAGVTPALQHVPEMAQALQSALNRTNGLIGAYGQASQFRRDLDRLMGQVSDAARSVRLLADYLDQHPDALLRGRR